MDWLLDSDQGQSRYPVLGYNLRWTDGQELLNGNTEGLGEASAAKPAKRFDSNTGYYDSFLTFSPERGTEDITAWIRLDAGYVVRALREYVYRITGLVVLISLFVTAGCLLALTPLLIRPLQKLDQLMQVGQTRGLRHIGESSEASKRRDELGNVFRSFYQLKRALISAEDQNISMTQRFQNFADLGADSFWETDRHLRITYAAGDVMGMFGASPDKLIGLKLSSAFNAFTHTLPPWQKLAQAIRANNSWEGAIHRTGTDEGNYFVRIVANPLTDADGRLTGVRGTAVDITVASLLESELKHHASHDSLTGLYNRREFDNILHTQTMNFRKTGNALCVCVLDLDRFKIVNDNCGHSAGDDLLKKIAELIQQHVREHDIVARYGGDEFAILLMGCSLNGGVRIAEAIRKSIDQLRFHWEDNVYNVGATIGIAEVSQQLCDAASVVMAADACCIRAKKMGRNQVWPYRTDDKHVAEHHGEIQWMSRINQALDENRLILYQQPIVSTQPQANQELHCEVLLRMLGRDGTIYSPGQFLPAAERYGLIGKIDRWVVSNTISWLSQQNFDASIEVCININLSAVTLSDDSFQAFLCSLLLESAIEPNELCFEITESVAMSDTSKAVEFLNTIRNLGCRIALDDFGTGFSSLSQIQTLPLDFIKIDGVFIKNITESQLDQTLVKCVADVARMLEVKTVAEFVEDDATLQALKELQIDFAQGYLFARPSPLTELPGLLRTGNEPD